ncbi:hypothetical protein D5086_000618 [Populus alba]|uniref:Uncharacterized protein n=1 Tax=Populus alba TaxID=43335 RepID=A0ACC4CWW2_POPAL
MGGAESLRCETAPLLQERKDTEIYISTQFPTDAMMKGVEDEIVWRLWSGFYAAICVTAIHTSAFSLVILDLE